MNTLRVIIRMLFASLSVMFRRVLGKKKFDSWSLSTELAWATTRVTLMAASDFGIKWLQAFSGSITPKPKLASEVNITKNKNSVGEYLEIEPVDTSLHLDKIVVYFHGGGYVMGSPEASLEYLTRFAVESGATLAVPYYPLAPDNKYPAAHEFAANFLVDLLNSHDPATIVVAGDSAGAGLALSSLLQIDYNTRKNIGGCLLVSPWVEPLASDGSIMTNSQNDVGDRDFVEACYHTYVANQDIQDSYPIDFTDVEVTDFCPTMVTVGSAEILLDQSKALAHRLSNVGVEVELRIYENMFHTFWNMAPLVPEAMKIASDVSDWVKSLETRQTSS